MIRPSRALCLATLSVVLSGCAWVTAVPVSPEYSTTEGIRIPRARPIVVVAGGNVSVVMVADNNHLLGSVRIS